MRRSLDVAAVLARVGLGLVVLWAGAVTAFDPDASISAVAGYRLLPGWAEEAVGLTLPWAEVALGILLVLGIATRATAVATGVLLTGFLVAMISARARGLQISCGCFGASEGEGITLVEIARDIGLLALAGLVAWVGTRAWGVDRWLERRV